ALDRIDVDAVAEHARDAPAVAAGADNHAVRGDVVAPAGAVRRLRIGDADGFSMRDAVDRRVEDEARTLPLAGLGEARDEGMDVAGGIRLRIETAIEIAAQRRLDRADFGRRDRTAVEPALLQQAVHHRRVVEARLVPADMQYAAADMVEIDALP